MKKANELVTFDYKLGHLTNRWFFILHIDKARFPCSASYGRKRDAERGAKRIAAKLGIVYRERV